MFVLTLTVVTQLQMPQLNTIPLETTQAIVKPVDIQPACNAQFLQSTYNPQQAGGQDLQPAAKVDTYQSTLTVQ